MSGLIANAAIILGSMQLSKRIDWEDPQILLGFRALYVVSNLIVFSIFGYAYMQIQKKAGMYSPKSRV
jgi:Phosphate transport (Pho88)